MTDIHSHILPGIDDGAKSLEEAVALLRAERENDVDTVVLTPHFHPNVTPLDKFLRRRERAYRRLQEEAGQLPALLLGAEVRFSADLPSMDLPSLCFDGKSHMLVELPESHFPPPAPEVLYELICKGVTPILAHIERYSYLIRTPDILDELLLSGVYTQVNAESLLRSRRMAKQLLSLIAEGKVHMIASDAHSMRSRPPLLKKAMALIEKKLGRDVVERLEKNARAALE